jgi:hypothetical protein
MKSAISSSSRGEGFINPQKQELYRVVAGGKTFHLTEAQVTFERDSLFASAFLGDFEEASSRTLR